MNRNDAKIKYLFDLSKTAAGNMLDKYEYPWEIILDINKIIMALINNSLPDYKRIEENVWIGENVYIEKTALIKGPAIIGSNTKIRHGAFIRGNALIGEGCVIGNSTEIKNCILFDKVQAPHFNYAGDSILGYKAHLGAGVKLSNVKSDKTGINIKFDDGVVKTQLKKIGAVIADNVEIGCNAVLNPGTVIGKNSVIYPLSLIRGTVGRDMILKHKEGKYVLVPKMQG